MNEEMSLQDINEAEIQMIENPELDARMNEVEKENLKEFWGKFWYVSNLYKSEPISSDQIDYVLGLIEDMELFMSQYPKAEKNCMFMVDYEDGNMWGDVRSTIVPFKKMLLNLKRHHEEGCK